jgi:hypothetical protein
MHALVHGCRIPACLIAVALLFAGGAQCADLRSGGAIAAWGTVCPDATGSASLDAFLGLGPVEAASRTEFSLFPYTLGSETLSLSVVRDWLSLCGEYQWSLLPLGITSATFLASVSPAPWEVPVGNFLVAFSIEGESRLTGYAFNSTPLRAEIWIKGAVSASRDMGIFDQASVGASLEATLSAPAGAIWPIPGCVLAASLGWATLASETVFALSPTIRVASETLTLRGSWRETGLTGELSCVFSEGSSGLSLGIEISYEFGDAPLRAFPSSAECSGGVCR